MSFLECLKYWLTVSWSNRPRKIECPVCGKIFWDYGDVKADCCSDKCQYEWIPF